MASSIGPTILRLTRVPSVPLSSRILYQQSRSMRLYRERTMRAMYYRSRQFDAVKYPERHRSEFLNWNYKSEIFAFSRRLQENLSEDTLRRVFAHTSYIDSLKESQKQLNLPDINLESNEKLIPRGEQLLDQCISPYLRQTLSRVPEDGIRAITNYLKSEPVLADIANCIGCKDIILSSEKFPSQPILAASLKALLAGIEQDLGIDRVQRFVVDMIITYINDKDILDDIWIIPNPTQTLNLLLKNSQLPNYEPRVMFHTGSSPGETLSIAEDCAALDTLKTLFDLQDHRAPFVYGEASEKIDYKLHHKEHPGIEAWRFELK